MIKHTHESNGTSLAWAAGAAINYPLKLIPFTMTSLHLEVKLNVTTTSAAGDYNDGWDRVIASLGLGRGSISYMNFLNMRPAYHFTRFQLREHAARRPSGAGNSKTGVDVVIDYYFHFGVHPHKADPKTNAVEYDPYDLTGGIPPSQQADLVISGLWGGANAVGSGYTINSGSMTAYFTGMAPSPGEPASIAMPVNFPSWEMKDFSNDLANASSDYATAEDFPIGDYLMGTEIFVASGSTKVRDEAALNNIKIWDTDGNRELWNAQDFIVAELETQRGLIGAPPSDDGVTLNVPSIAHSRDAGLLYFDFRKLASKPDPDLGLILKGLQKSVLQWQYGVGTVTLGQLLMLQLKYVKNAAHPANQGQPNQHPTTQKNIRALIPQLSAVGALPTA